MTGLTSWCKSGPLAMNITEWTIQREYEANDGALDGVSLLAPGPWLGDEESRRCHQIQKWPRHLEDERASGPSQESQLTCSTCIVRIQDDGFVSLPGCQLSHRR